MMLCLFAFQGMKTSVRFSALHHSSLYSNRLLHCMSCIQSYLRSRWYEKESRQYCHASSKELEDRLELLSDISTALTQSAVIHWLCYGTLWGVIRGNKLLRYDKDGDICTLDADVNAVEKGKFNTNSLRSQKRGGE